MTDEERLALRVDHILEVHLRTIDISPAWVATEVLNGLEFTAQSSERQRYPLVYAGCHLALRQIARGKLRRHDPIETAHDAIAGQGEIFPETLQDRYPRKVPSDAEPIYALRDHLTANDVKFNVNRMRRAGNALLKHADALEAWHTDRPRSAA